MLQVFLFSLIVFGSITLAYLYIGHKRKKSNSDIRMRRILIETFSYSFIIALCALLIAAHWQGYIRIWGGKGKVDDFTLLVELLALGLYFIVKPIRKAMETVYTIQDIKDIVTCSLYLRSFNTDKLKGEKNICKIFNKYCPTLSIGNPNAILPFTHSKRIYVTDDNWKSAVEDLMQKARVILLRVGNTDGTKWEISKVLINNHLRKTIFLVYSAEDYYLLQDILSSYRYKLPPMNSSNFENLTLAYYISADGYSWNANSIQSKKQIKKLLGDFKSQREEIAKENRITLTGKKRSFWTWFWGNGELPYYRIRVFVYLFFAAIIANLFGAYGIKVFNSKQYALSESSWGWVNVDKANIIEEGKYLDSEELRSYSISPDYNSLTIHWKNGVTTYFDLASDSLMFTFLEWDNPCAIGYNYDGSQSLAIIKNDLVIGKDSIITGVDGIKYHETIVNRVVPGFKNLRMIAYFDEDENTDDEVTMYEESLLDTFNGMNLLLIGSNLLSYSDYDGLSITNIEKPSDSKSLVGSTLDGIGFCRTDNLNSILYSPEGKDIFLYNLDTESKTSVIQSACATPKNIYTDAQTKTYATVGKAGLFSTGKRQFVIDLYNKEFDKLFSCIGHSWTVTSLAFSPDGSRLVSMSNDNTVRVWDTCTGKEICRVIIEDSYSDDDFAVFAGNGKKILIYIKDSLYLYNIE